MAEQEQQASAATELVTAPESQVGALALINLSPEKYAAEVYQPFKDQLQAAIDSVRAVDYDIKTGAGMAVAIKCRALFRDMRIAADKEREFRKAPLTKIGKLLQSGYVEVEQRITPLEEMFDADIDAEVQRKAEEKAERERLDAERVAEIRAKIDAIRARPMRLSGEASEDIKAVAMDLAAMQIAETEYAEFTEEVTRVVDEVGQELTIMFQAALAREQAEAEQLRVLAEQQALIAQQFEANRLENERLDKLRKEAAEAEAERQRVIAKEEAERQRVARETKAQMEEMAAELGKKRREQEQVDAARREAEARRENLMAELQALQHQTVIAVTGRAPYCTGGDVRSFLHVLEETRAWDVSESYFGELAGMAQMVKNSVLVTLEQGLKDHLAAELPAAHEEAISMNIAFDMMLPPAKFPYPPDYTAAAAPMLPAAIGAPSTVDSSPVVAEKLPCGEFCDIAELVVLDTSVTDQEIIAMVADYYHLTTLETIDRLAQIDFVAARAREQAAA